jgi:phage tail-like protein
MDNQNARLSQLMQYLPAVYYGLDDTDLAPGMPPPDGELRPPFLSDFLLAFEKLLLAREDDIDSTASPGPDGRGTKGASDTVDSEDSELEDEDADRSGTEAHAEPRVRKGKKKKTHAETRESRASDLRRKDDGVAGGPKGSGSGCELWGGGLMSLEDEVSELHCLFEPEHTPERFLAWLAGWAALSLEASLSEERKRELVARIIPLYRIRGTRGYLEELLRLHLEAGATIAVEDEELPPLQVGRFSTVGKDCYLGGGAPHWFRVRIEFLEADWQRVEPQCQLARRVIDLAKPAHTLYELNVKAHRMQIAVHSTVGVDTIFGS